MHSETLNTSEISIKESDPRTKISTRAWIKGTPFYLIHLVALVAPFLIDFQWGYLALAIGSYYLRMFAITAGYHRYFSHKTYKTSRLFQFLMGFLGTTATQKGPLWWGAGHRHHHKFSDTKDDIHSPVQDGFLYSHMGWILADSSDPIRWNLIKDLSRYKELRFLDQHYWLPPVIYGIICFAFFGVSGVIWGYFVSTVMLWHGTYTINSLCHVWGTRRYKTTDTSRNNFFLSILTLGEGWHNNHHYYCNSVNQGWFWWEIDISYYILIALEKLGIVWDLKHAPQRVKESNLI